ncbi:MAG: hemolysin III family protein [Kiritimatiellae bacterium]|nr:hemolysin III family protein [Kiritimatiellia bacterium]MBP5788162.1 hemolysin III family protein [Kiritimatiellia bacterium]
MKDGSKGYTLGEEIASAVTHGVGAGLAIAALVILAVVASRAGALHVVSCVIYASGMLLMFLMSTLYHSFPPGTTKRVFQILDHEMIFLMIAGSYTPFVLITLKGALGWWLFGTIWGLAVAGMVFQAFCTGRFRLVTTGLYVAMGWIIVFAIRPLLAQMSAAGVRWLWIGGACYTLGAVVYLFKKVPYLHFVWHLAVLAGAICHFFCVLWHVAPPGGA